MNQAETGSIEPFDAVVLNARDNCATLLKSARAGQTVSVFVAGGGAPQPLTLADDIEFGHKAAMSAIAKGGAVVKYGEVIGAASRDIAPGAHVHVHNVESLRARGDMSDASDASDGQDRTQQTGPAPHFEALTAQAPVADVSGRTFLGWPRPDGSAGTRNLVGVLSCVVCANDVAARLAGIEGVAVFTHQQGCSQTGPDVRVVSRVLVNLAANPNLGAVLLVSLGCESVPAEELLQQIRASGKPARLVVIQKEGGLEGALARCREIVAELKDAIACDPVEVPVQKLRVGLKCGSSDTTQGLSANPVCGLVTDMLAAAGAGVVIGETTEFMGAEHIAARHAKDAQTAAAIVGLVADMEARAKAMGVDMRGGQPTRGNIAGGLTTIEEKSLGALAKAGSAVFQKCIAYGERCTLPGLVMMDAPGREPEMLTGLAAVGCNVIVFTTGRGAPQGFPFVPVVKVTGNARTAHMMADHIDVCAAGVMDGSTTPPAAALDLFEAILGHASGRPTAAEKTGYLNSMNIYVTGPVI